MQVSVIPTFWCNGSCEFCYSKNSLTDKTVLDLTLLEKRLREISSIDEISVYGGELGLLSESYLRSLFTILKKYCQNVYGQTNLTKPWILFLFKEFGIPFATSLNEERKINRKTIENIKSIPNQLREELTVLMVVTPSVIKSNPLELFKFLEDLGVSGVQFVRYSPSVDTGDLYHINEKDYEDFLIRVFNEKDKTKLELINFEIWKNQVTKNSSDTCVFISPYGKVGTVDFNSDGLEYFEWFDTMDEFRLKSKKDVLNIKCISCKYYNNGCLADHIHFNKCYGMPRLRGFINA